jgi:hypothetical protein
MAAERDAASEQSLNHSLRAPVNAALGTPAGGAAWRRAAQQEGATAGGSGGVCDLGEYEPGPIGDEAVDVLQGSAWARAPVRPLPPVTAVVAPGKHGTFKKVGDSRMPPAAGSSLGGGALGCSGGCMASCGGGRASAATGRASGTVEPAGVVVLLPLPLRLAGTVQIAWLASGRVAPGLMAGAAALELVMLSQAREQPLSPFLLYADACHHFGRIYMWGGLASAVASGLLLLRRRRSRYFRTYPLARLPPVLMLVCSAVTLSITVGLREASFHIGSPATRAALPYRVPLTSDAYLAIVRGTGPFGDPISSAVLLRALFCVGSLLLSYLPDADEPPELPAQVAARLDDPIAAAVGGRLIRPHLLAGDYAEAPDGGATVLLRGAMFTIGFGMPRPVLPSAPDGKPPPVPVPESGMSRDGFAGRAATVVGFLSADAAVSLMSNSLYFEQAVLSSGPPADGGDGSTNADGFARMLPDIMQLILFTVCRVVVSAQLFAVLTQTTAFKVGRLTPLIKHFRRPFVVHGAAFASSLVMIGVRVVAAADVTQPLLFFGRSPLGSAYTVLLFVHLPMTALYYVSTLDALRRLARSEYYLDNDRAAF